MLKNPDLHLTVKPPEKRRLSGFAVFYEEGRASQGCCETKRVDLDECSTYLMYSLLFAFVTLISDPPGLRSFIVTYKHMKITEDR